MEIKGDRGFIAPKKYLHLSTKNELATGKLMRALLELKLK